MHFFLCALRVKIIERIPQFNSSMFFVIISGVIYSLIKIGHTIQDLVVAVEIVLIPVMMEIFVVRTLPLSVCLSVCLSVSTPLLDSYNKIPEQT